MSTARISALSIVIEWSLSKTLKARASEKPVLQCCNMETKDQTRTATAVNNDNNNSETDTNPPPPNPNTNTNTNTNTID